jgi:ABC-type enterochelin transport system, permease component
MPPDRARDIRRVTLLVALLAILSALAFMTVGVRGSWSFVLAHRGVRLAALVTVAYTIAVSTVLFQTLTGNRILTPAIMGFDALFLLLQTALVAVLGGAGASALDPRLLFAHRVSRHGRPFRPAVPPAVPGRRSEPDAGGPGGASCSAPCSAASRAFCNGSWTPTTSWCCKAGPSPPSTRSTRP